MCRRTLIVSGLRRLYGFGSGEACGPILVLSRKLGCFQRRSLDSWNRGSTTRKNRKVRSRRNRQLQGPFSARSLVKLLQPLSQPMRLNACDGVFPGVEGGLGAGKYLRGYVVLGKLIALTPKIFLTDVVQEVGEPGRSAKRFRNGLKFLAFCFRGSFLEVYLHGPGPRRSAYRSQHWIIQSLARGLQRRPLHSVSGIIL